MITFVCFRWGKKYQPEYVNILKRMIDRNCTVAHELVCATDDAAGLNEGIRAVPVERELVPLGNAFPKLVVFRPDAGAIFGKRICVIDLDVVITGSIDAIVGRPEPFVIWQDVLANSQPMRFKYNSSMILMDAGARSQVWEMFSPAHVRMMMFCGSDQAWISQLLNGEATWSAADGILSWRLEVDKKPTPDTARIIFFHGKPKPWALANNSLIKQHWN